VLGLRGGGRLVFGWSVGVLVWGFLLLLVLSLLELLQGLGGGGVIGEVLLRAV
jgi:hypothetical protein